MLIILSPQIVYAQLDPRCWTKEMCIQARKDNDKIKSMSAEEILDGFVQTQETAKICGTQDAKGKTLGFCLPASQTIAKIAFGGKEKFLHLGDFIQTLYRYSIITAGILAVIMLIVAGFIWTTSGGNAERIGSARKKIGGALIGLFLVVLSYSILDLLNPAMVNLRLPQIWMVRTDELKITELGADGLCDPTKGSETRNICEAQGKYCYAIGGSDENGPCAKIAETIAIATVTALGGTLIAGEAGLAPLFTKMVNTGKATITRFFIPKTVIEAGGILKAMGGSSALGVTFNGIKIGTKIIVVQTSKNTIKVGGVVLGAHLADYAMDIAGVDITFWEKAKLGLCLDKTQSLEKGDMCRVPKPDEINPCRNGLICLKDNVMSNATGCWVGEEKGDLGICSDGLVDSKCNSDSDCKNNMKCVVHKGTSVDLKMCTDGSLGKICENDNHCKSKTCYRNRCANEGFTGAEDLDICNSTNECKQNLRGDWCYAFDENCTPKEISTYEIKKGICISKKTREEKELGIMSETPKAKIFLQEQFDKKELPKPKWKYAYGKAGTDCW